MHKRKNNGKVFEGEFKASVSHEIWYYRFKDGTANFTGQKNENIRFQASNICDCELYYYPYLFLIELKTTQLKSLAFSMVRSNQVNELEKASKFKGIYAGFLVNFRTVEETYYISIQDYLYCMNNYEAKSIPIKYFQENCILVQQVKKKVHYTFGVTDMLIDIFKNNKKQDKLF